MKNQRRLIAQIVRPVGIKGELKARCLLRNSALYKKLQCVIIDDREYAVTKVSAIPDFVTFKLKGIEDRNESELFRDKAVYADEEQATLLREGDYFVDDLIGLELLREGVCLGKITEIYSFAPSCDTIQAEDKDGKRLNFPNVQGVISEVNFENGIVIVNAERFDEVTIYED